MFSRWNLFKVLRHEKCDVKLFSEALPQVCAPRKVLASDVSRA